MNIIKKLINKIRNCLQFYTTESFNIFKYLLLTKIIKNHKTHVFLNVYNRFKEV